MGEGDSERLALRVTGRVQGVGFRWSARREAERLGLRGSVRNRADGSVEVHAEGPRDAVASFRAWLERGPRGAQVVRVEPIASDGPLPGPGFRILT